jgi:hypothetical protein
MNPTEDEMPALELRVAETLPHASATRLRSLMEKRNAVVLRYQPAYLRLDQRSIGIGYGFRGGLVLGIAGDIPQFHEEVAGIFDSVSSLSEFEDSRAGRFSVRLPNSAIGNLRALLHSSLDCLNENSYKNILGS